VRPPAAVAAVNRIISHKIPRPRRERIKVRVIADIGLKCLNCQRKMLAARDVLRRRAKEFVSKSD
jgi:hypothetical protein